jgi:hypothetical protein
MKQVLGALVLSCVLAGAAAAQSGQQVPVPQPYPGQAPPTRPAAQEPARPAQQPTSPPAETARPLQPGEVPTEATLGLPIQPNAQFITSYDAGRGQRFYLFGTAASFADVVAFYKSVLKQKGELVFEEPATHVFEVGRYREDVMGFPPSVTVKDYTWGNMRGYANPKPGAEPSRFPTVIQIVPIPAATPEARR